MKFLERPWLVMFFCFVFLVLSLALDGTVHSWQRLRSETQRVIITQVNVERQIQALRVQLKEAGDVRFIEKRALEVLGLASENDILFVFGDGEDSTESQAITISQRIK